MNTQWNPWQGMTHLTKSSSLRCYLAEDLQAKNQGYCWISSRDTD